MFIFEFAPCDTYEEKEMTSNTLPRFSQARSVILAKDTMAVMVKLETKIEESTCGVFDYVMVFHHKAHSRNN